MAKRVVVIASGETERRALPHLVKHPELTDIEVTEVRIPPRNRALKPEVVENLIRAAWFSNLHQPPDKFVVLVDADRHEPTKVLAPFEEVLPRKLDDISAQVIFTYAQQHLEAWYFGDAERLKEHLSRPLGAVDTSSPDEIDNPKLHLKHLLAGRVYTSRVSEEIARRLDSESISQRSPSFRRFVKAVLNGDARCM